MTELAIEERKEQNLIDTTAKWKGKEKKVAIEERRRKILRIRN